MLSLNTDSFTIYHAVCNLLIFSFISSSANATPEFEGRGGEELANMISNMMQRAYHTSQAFKLEQLSILEGKQCWKLYIDILVCIVKIINYILKHSSH